MKKTMAVIIPILALSGLGSAAPVAIVNPGFESADLPLVGNGQFSQLIPGSTIFASGGTLDGWTAGANTVNATAGAFNPSPGGNNWTSNWWQGNNIGYLQLSGPGVVSLLQVLSDTLQNDATYTLTVDIGRRIFTPNQSYSIDLYAGNTLLASASNLSLASNSAGTKQPSRRTEPRDRAFVVHERLRVHRSVFRQRSTGCGDRRNYRT
jgi:hypothetical protein